MRRLFALVFVVLVLAACGGSKPSASVASPTSIARAPAPTSPGGTAAASTAAATSSAAGATTSGVPPTAGATAATATSPTVKPGRVILVGDSVMAALNPGYTDAARKVLGPAGWNVVIDAKVDRSTLEGRRVLRSLHPGPNDTVVIMLGHNDAGTPSVFGPRVDGIMQDLAGVHRVFWLTMREPRYTSADAVLTADLARYPNLHLIPWAASIQPGWTARDGLHLNASGATGMAHLILQAISS